MDPFIGAIHIFAGTFAPRGWAFCDGQLLAISSNDALFSLLGTTYGGDGRSTFGLPDLRGRLPVHPDATLPWGGKGGFESVALTEPQNPRHTHPWQATSGPGQNASPAGGGLAAPTGDIYAPPGDMVGMSPSMVAPAGSSAGHDNMMPFQCVNFIIALVGVYPSRQ